jgi:hypothetical protein
MKILPFEGNNWDTYVSWFERRGEHSPTMPKQAIFVGRDDNTLIAGACCYVGEDRYMRMDYFSFEEGANTSEVMESTEFILVAADGLASILGKIIIVSTDVRYVNTMLESVGFTKHPHTMWSCIPGRRSPVKVVDKTPEAKEDKGPANKPKAGSCIRCKSSFIKVTGREKLCPECKGNK